MNQRPKSRVWRSARLALVTLAALAATGPACLSRPVEPLDPRTTSTINERLTQSSVDKIDILLAIDNSASMGDKQDILNKAVPDLVGRLVNPVCVDPDTEQPLPPDQQPTDPTAKCPGTSQREFDPVLDIHIGIVSSSLGNHGSPDSTVCPEQTETNCPAGQTNYTDDDHAHLITRTNPCSGAVAETYQNLGFLAWDPKHKYDPPGEMDLAKLTTTIADLVTGTGQIGCGLEAQNESWYRFLADPNPYESLAFEGNKTVPKDRDEELLKERADFLRPDSLLAIVMLTDENDCSVEDRGPGWAVATTTTANGPFVLPHGSSVCATNPNDACCYSCASKPPSGCDPDPSCSSPSATDDKLNLRCFDEKRRFGIDFLYPMQRYVNALTQAALNPSRADLADDGKGTTTPNPIFSDLDPNDLDVTIRTPDLVFLAGIVGVPWQDIAKDPNDLGQGFKTVEELSAVDANGVSGWDTILGDPTGGGDGKPPVPPADAHMIESTTPRKGLADVGASDDADPIHGHEYTTSPGLGDLEYACIFPLPTPKDCSGDQTSCDCNDPNDATNDTNPLCRPNPNDGGKSTLQVAAKAYPGTRHLEILKGLGPQGIVASVCAKQLADPKASDYGYRPAIVAIIEKLKNKLGGQCLPRTLKAAEGKVPCVIIEASKSEDPATCNQCEAPAGRQPVDPLHQQAVVAAQEDELNATAHWNCFCEMTQLGGDAQKACQNDAPDDDKSVTLDGQPVNGWCYVDPGAGVGNPDVVEKCDSAEKRKIRFVGPDGGARPGSTLFITCSGDSAL